MVATICCASPVAISTQCCRCWLQLTASCWLACCCWCGCSLDHWQGIVVMGYCPIARAQKFGETVVKILAQSTLRADKTQCATWLWLTTHPQFQLPVSLSVPSARRFPFSVIIRVLINRVCLAGKQSWRHPWCDRSTVLHSLVDAVWCCYHSKEFECRPNQGGTGHPVVHSCLQRRLALQMLASAVSVCSSLAHSCSC